MHVLYRERGVILRYICPYQKEVIWLTVKQLIEKLSQEGPDKKVVYYISATKVVPIIAIAAPTSDHSDGPVLTNKVVLL